MITALVVLGGFVLAALVGLVTVARAAAKLDIRMVDLEGDLEDFVPRLNADGDRMEARFTGLEKRMDRHAGLKDDVAQILLGGLHHFGYYGPDGFVGYCTENTDEDHKDALRDRRKLHELLSQVESVLTPDQRRKLNETRAIGPELAKIEAYRKQNKD